VPESFSGPKEKLAEACLRLQGISQCEYSINYCGGYKIYLQFNPQRAVSSGAAVDAESIKSRPCFYVKTICRVNSKAFYIVINI